ncbi:MAG TPA: hypothetical protein VNL16_04305, partial [Chloroflexota bacterium]|nr:hypothetical protein [Chloroflexota bacterium]
METRTDRQSAGGPDIAPTLASTAPGTICRVPAGVVETHISILFFVGDRVFKLRKPVQFGFVDFRQREARRQDCEREVALNQRLAPDVYLGVADLSLQGVPLDHMVVMRRMPEDRRLATMALRGDDLGEPVHQIARTMATFHRRAARSATISAEATAEAVGAGWEQNLQETSRFVGTVLDAEIDAAIRALAARWVSGRAPLLKARIAAGHVCDGHGDLQAGDIFCLPDGVRILDCLEFSDHLRYADVCADVAFLAMDLERLGFREAAGQFVVAYEEAAHDRFPDTLVHFSCASRAYVRAKVACLRAEQGASDAAAEARLLHDLA